MSQWIWKFGEYEIYHNLLRHSQRQHYGYTRPPMWKIYMPDPVVRFRKTVTTMGGMLHIKKCGDLFVTLQMAGTSKKVELNGKTDFYLPKGTVTITLLIMNRISFPCAYVYGVVESDETWIADDNTSDWKPVGTSDEFCDPEKTPENFPFSYQKIDYVDKEYHENGVLYDFGKETFARTRLWGFPHKKKKITVCFGESREEALDQEWSVIHFEGEPQHGELTYRPYAFRYIFVNDTDAQIEAEYEYLPLEQKGYFSSKSELLDKIWDTAAYTFALNCREFILDGIKRDGWVWSADAYQSFFVNRYLYLDQDLERRTLIALAGKKPVKQHINTIVDYTFFWLISLWDYYQTYGDRKFLEQIHEQTEEIMCFCLGRSDEDGFMRGRKGDWIFIDWALMDRTGALCGEQILFAKAMESYSKICRVLGAEDNGCGEKAAKLKKAIQEKFFDTEKGVFVDSYESGKRMVTRHTNLLAYLFLPCTEQQKKDIYEKVILNEDITPITTPYFKFYENQVHCLEGKPEKLEESIIDYYGKMLETGATTLYEAFDPTESGTQHYAMYGQPYEKSLCHAWSASPIYLLGRYRLGVKNTGIAYDTFEVEPVPGKLQEFSGTVPVPGGTVSVSVRKECIAVKADIPGGTLIWKGKRYVLTAGQEFMIKE